ncbi:MAG: alpha/beta fold hydrolase [Gammaproteobacteria bacterium]|nr:alpha/beta fold hydrolase [Gammaproteobacteria bacterium]
MSASRALVYFAHGKESGPWGTKIIELAKVARDFNCEVVSGDFRGIDDPEQRVDYLLKNFPAMSNTHTPLVLVGSSMGAYVVASAAEQLKPQGLYLLAPAIGLPGFGRQNIHAVTQVMEVVHGWNDEIVPVQYAIQFSQQHKSSLHLVNDEHRLIASLPQITQWFAYFLRRTLSL